MIKNYLMVGLVCTMIASTQTSATNDQPPLFIDGTDVGIRVSYLREIAKSGLDKRGQPAVRRFMAPRRTCTPEVNMNRLSRMDFKTYGFIDHLSLFDADESLTFQWNKESGEWVYSSKINPDSPETKFFTISPVTKILTSTSAQGKV